MAVDPVGRGLFTFLVGGKAGEGVKKAGSVASSLFADMGRHVCQMDDYQSLIRGGHNFSVVSTAVGPISSHYMQAQFAVSLDDRSFGLHRDHLAPDGVMVYNSDTTNPPDGDGRAFGLPITAEAKKYPRPELRVGVAAPAALCAALGLDKAYLRSLIEREYRRDLENNIPYAESIYDLAYAQFGGRYALRAGAASRQPIMDGAQAIALGAIAAGLDLYFAYPMTPSSSLLHFLASHAKEFGIVVEHPENEIAVANMAIGAAAAGARAMCGSSGGGLALMEEAFSLAGMAEVPILYFLGSRPGPSTGLPTYTSQGDLRFALNQGHGEFPRIVASPGSIEDGYYLTAEMLSLVWLFQTPGILLSEKHFTEGTMSVDLAIDAAAWAEPLLSADGDYRRYRDTATGISPLPAAPEGQVVKWSSYEHDERGITTEEPLLTTKMVDKRLRKQAGIVEVLKRLNCTNRYEFGNGNAPVILTYGSTTLSVLEAVRAGGIEATVVQPRYLEPLPVWDLEQYQGRPLVVVEMSASGQFANLLAEKAGLRPRAVIRRYDGRPFDPVELAQAIKGAL